MCSRFELSNNPRDIMAALKLQAPPALPNRPVVRPTDLALLMTPGRGSDLQTWGLAVDWSKQPMINARAETLTDKPTFRPLLEHRCVVPASAYFEWRKTATGQKLKNTICAANAPLMTMAGLTDGNRFTIVTCAPSPSIAHIHNRMPVILSERALDSWISDAPFERVCDILVPYAGPLHYEEDVPEPPAQADLFG